jgi:hypothetical protein
VPGAISVQSAAARLLSEGHPCHLVWDPVTGEIAQLISILRAGLALGATGGPACASARPGASAQAGIRGAGTVDVNTEGRVCAQIGVLGHCADPFTSGPLAGVTAIVSWLDSWGVPRRWPAGRPGGHVEYSASRARALWALGGHFGASQVPGSLSQDPGRIDTDLLTGTQLLQMHSRDPRHARSAAALPIPA